MLPFDLPAIITQKIRKQTVAMTDDDRQLTAKTGH